MNVHAHYFRIGVFVIAAVSLLVVAIIVLGAGALFEERIPVETYINESVQGLDAGAMVKYRGVKVGNVKEITFVQKYYQTERPYILIRLLIDPNLLADPTRTDVRGSFMRLVERGLRIRWAAQGLTGTAYLELDFFEPADNPPLEIDWEPVALYIPSATSALGRLTGAVEQVFRQLEEADIASVFENLDGILRSLKEQIGKVNLPGLSQEVQTLVRETRDTNAKLQAVLDSPDTQGLPAKINGVFDRLDRTVETSGKDLDATLKELRSASEKINRIVKTVNDAIQAESTRGHARSLGLTLDHLSSTTAHLPETVAGMNQALRRLDQLLAQQQDSLPLIMDNLRRVSQDLSEVTGRLREYPSYSLFGEPPKPSEPGK